MARTELAAHEAAAAAMKRELQNLAEQQWEAGKLSRAGLQRAVDAAALTDAATAARAKGAADAAAEHATLLAAKDAEVARL